MRRTFIIAISSPVLLAAAYGQTSKDRAKLEFDAASIRVSEPQGFHAPADTSTGGPGTSDPGLYRCANCKLATLISKAFDLKGYQFPGKAAAGENSFDVMARVPAGTTQDEFLSMLQNLLKERFALTYHYTEKSLRGYHLTVAKNGPKLQESSKETRPPGADARRAGPGDAHTHDGVATFFGTTRYRGEHQTMGDLARLLADQIRLPVDDETGLKGEYDISLQWSGTGESHSDSAGHAGGAWSGGDAHGDHGGGGAGAPAGAGGRGGESAPALFDALQTQLGLKLVSAAQTVARIFVIDHVEHLPTAN